MTQAQLLERFAGLAEAPDAVNRLRQFVLDLAVRGKLVEHDAMDESGRALFERVRAEATHLIKNGEIRKRKPLALLGADEMPFDIPASWAWSKLGEITSYIQRGKSPKYGSGDGCPPIISQKCVQWDGLHMEWAKTLTAESLDTYEPYRFLREGDLLWNSTGTGTLGRVIRVDQRHAGLLCDSHVTVVRCLLADESFVAIWLRSNHVYGAIEGRAAGATNQVELTASMANNQPVPLPPLAEQHRIVAKVDELMALCDELEAAQAQRESRRDRLVTATLHALNNGATPPDQRRAARFYFNHLPRLTTRPHHVRQLRQTILNLAVRGKLAPQDPNDEPAALLLKRIALQRRKLLEEGVPNEAEARTQLKKQKAQRVPLELKRLPRIFNLMFYIPTFQRPSASLFIGARAR